MKIEYNSDSRNEVALAVLAVHESGCFLSEVAGKRVWFSPDEHERNICIHCYDDEWTVTWAYLSVAPEHKTYKQLLKYLKQMVVDFGEVKGHGESITCEHFAEGIDESQKLPLVYDAILSFAAKEAEKGVNDG